jgi:hypothetical protein
MDGSLKISEMTIRQKLIADFLAATLANPNGSNMESALRSAIEHADLVISTQDL